MPTTRTILVYKYDELSDNAKDNVKTKYIAPNIDLEYVIDNAKHEGVERGFEIEDVSWSGFSSQGDGASWTGRVLLDKFLNYHLKENHADYARYTVLLTLAGDGWVDNFVNVGRKAFMYNHSGTMTIDQPYMGYVNAKDDATIGTECPLQGASVPQLYEGIDINNLLDDLYQWMLREAKSYADEIYKDLEAAYDDEMSDQHVSVMADANEWEFDETGRLI